MCVGRTPEETLAVLLDALPTALGCSLVYLQVPGSPPQERGTVKGAAMTEEQLAQLRLPGSDQGDGGEVQLAMAGAGFHCLALEVPVGKARGRLLAGRSGALDPGTDRILIRAAANIVGTTLESANVLEAARRKDDFLAMLGHELRNPLAPILTAVELLARNPSVSRERAVIERHTRHLARLVDDLLDISRVTRGHVELRDEQVWLTSVIERAVEIAAPLVARKRHTLAVQDASGLALQGDSVRLAQVFANLLTNAAKFTPPGGSIEVIVDRLAGRVRVTVRDNGAGIAGNQLARIFEPFVQADREPDTLSGGLGLGLAIVRNLVDRHGGSISVRSEGRGRGAAFTVELPTIPASEMLAATVTPRPSVVRAGIRVLVVDDNVDVAELLSEALEGEGFQTAIAHDGRAALERWRSFTPHAAVLDVGLPDLDGYELARALRAEHGRRATLIAATGYGQPADRLRASEAGFDCHFVKPVSVQDLVLALDQRVTVAG
jgi:signal transduction histidine kinase/CheY-like chemotaxis protein